MATTALVARSAATTASRVARADAARARSDLRFRPGAVHDPCEFSRFRHGPVRAQPPDRFPVRGHG